MPDPTSPPENLEEAEIRRKRLTAEVQDIQAQLGDKHRTTEDGRRLNAKEYWEWRRRAQHSLNKKLDELRDVKDWIRKQVNEIRAARPDSAQPSFDLAIYHLKNLCDMTVQLAQDGVEFNEEERVKIEAAQKFLHGLGLTSA